MQKAYRIRCGQAAIALRLGGISSKLRHRPRTGCDTLFDHRIVAEPHLKEWLASIRTGLPSPRSAKLSRPWKPKSTSGGPSPPTHLWQAKPKPPSFIKQSVGRVICLSESVLATVAISIRGSRRILPPSHLGDLAASPQQKPCSFQDRRPRKRRCSATCLLRRQNEQEMCLLLTCAGCNLLQQPLHSSKGPKKRIRSDDALCTVTNIPKNCQRMF